MVGKISPFFYSGKLFPLGTPKTPLLWCSVCRSSCYVRARSTGHFFSVRSLFNGKSSDKSKEKIQINIIQQAVKVWNLKVKIKIKGRFFHRFTTASTCSPPVPVFDCSSTVSRGSLVVRPWFNSLLRLRKHLSEPVQNGSGQVRQI